MGVVSFARHYGARSLPRMTDRNTSMQRDVTAQIVRFNAGRDSERLALKYKALRSCAFSFLRGTCHLFWSQVPPVVVTAMGKILAWGQLRSSGIHPAACAGELVAFGQDAHRWSPALIELAANMAERLEADWRAFRDKPPSG